MPDLVGAERLGQIVSSSASDRIDGRFEGGIGCQHDHPHVRILDQESRQQIEAVELAQPQIEKRDVERPLRKRSDGVFAGAD